MPDPTPDPAVPPDARALTFDEGRFAEWSAQTLAEQCRMQARDSLDTDFMQFMEAVATRLAAPPASIAAVPAKPPTCDLLTYAADEFLIAAVKLANNGDHKTAERMDVARERVLAARDEIQGMVA